jgi:hypothetical protein
MNVDASSFCPSKRDNTAFDGDYYGNSSLSASASQFVPVRPLAGSASGSRTGVSLSALEFIPREHTSSLARSKAPPLCRFFLQGACRKGRDCPFAHDATVAAAARQNNKNNKNALDSIANKSLVEDGIECEFGAGASIVRLHLEVNRDKEPYDNVRGGVAVKVQWYAPSRCAWASFAYADQAQRAARACHGTTLGKRVLSVKTSAPKSNGYPFPGIATLRGRTSSCSISIGNLDDSVTHSKLKNFVERHAKCKVVSLDLGDLPFSEQQGPSIVKRLLVGFGQLTLFDLKRKALVRFADTKDADRACLNFKEVDRVKELGGSKLFLHRIFTAKYTVPTNVMDVIHELLKDILSSLPVRYSTFDNVATRSILIRADESAVIDSVKQQLLPIVSGEVLRES